MGVRGMREEIEKIVESTKEKRWLEIREGEGKFISNVLNKEYRYRGSTEKKMARSIAKFIGAVGVDDVYVPEFIEEELAVLWFEYCYSNGVLVERSE